MERLGAEITELELIGIVSEQVVTAACASLCEDRRQRVLVEFHALDFVQQVVGCPNVAGHTCECLLPILRMQQMRLPRVVRPPQKIRGFRILSHQDERSFLTRIPWEVIFERGLSKPLGNLPQPLPNDPGLDALTLPVPCRFPAYDPYPAGAAACRALTALGCRCALRGWCGDPRSIPGVRPNQAALCHFH